MKCAWALALANLLVPPAVSTTFAAPSDLKADLKAESKTLAVPLPAGRAEAFFKIERPGDQMTTGPLPKATLVAVVRVGDKEHIRRVATCKSFGLGNALGGGTETWLEAAHCGDMYWLMSEPGRVTVLRKAKGADATVATVELPEGVKAVGQYADPQFNP